MSKKPRGKSGAGSAGTSKWDSALVSAPFSDPSWTTHITLLIPNKIDDNVHLDILSTAVAAQTRRLFSVITKDDLMNQVKEFGNPKTVKKGKETPQHTEVCEPCKAHLDNNEDIPLPLLARLLKFKFLQVKVNDAKRRDNEKKAAAEKAKGGGGKGGKGGDKGRERSKSPKKGGKGNKTPEPPSVKNESKLKKRGEEDLDSKYIDDEPDDGAQQYVLVHGFYHPHLVTYLQEVGIIVDSIIKVSTQDYARFAPLEDPEAPPKPDAQITAEDEARKDNRRKQRELNKFWKDLLPVLQATPPDSKIHDLARLEYTVSNLIIPENLEDNEKRTEFGVNLFEDIACMIYDLLDAKRQYKNYLENMKLIPIPLTKPPDQVQIDGASTVTAPTGAVAPSTTHPDGTPLPPASSCVDMRYYKELMDSVPQESVSVPLILYCMLEQVEATDEDRPPPSEVQQPPRQDGLDHDLAAHLGSLAAHLGLTEEEEADIGVEIPKPEKKLTPPNEPELLKFKDEISTRTGHLKSTNGFEPIKAENDMLKFLPFSGLGNLPRPVSRVAKERAARLQELIYFCATEGLTPSEIDRAFKQFVFECMDVTSVDSNGFIVTKQGEGAHVTAIPWDDPYPFFKDMIPKIEDEDEQVDNERSASRSTIRSGARSPDRSRTPSADGSRPGTPGILKSSTLTPEKSRRSSINDSETDSSRDLGTTVHSVHFGIDHEGNAIEPLPPSPPPIKTVDETINDVVDSMKRNLDQWCFAEHFEPNVLLQVMREAAYTLPYIDTYYHKRDHSLMVILHNPHGAELLNDVSWENNLHSNVGFRNYLEHVAESIAEWTKTEEAKYEATKLAEEVEQIRKDSSSMTEATDKKRARSKSPKKGSKSKSRSRSATPDRAATPTDLTIRPNSLKAWKIEQDRIKAEEEEKARAAAEKRAKSASKKTISDSDNASDDAGSVLSDDASRESQKNEKEDKKRPGSRGSAKSRKSSKERKSDENLEPAQLEEPKEPEEFWPFTGYDVGNDLIHVSGNISSLFPADGGLIKTERIDYVQGTTSVKATIAKDGHVFNIHVLDPKDLNEEEESPSLKSTPRSEGEPEDDEEKEKAELEKSEKEEKGLTDTPPSVSFFGSFSAEMSDGMSLSLSKYGSTGIPQGTKKREVEPFTPPPSREPSPAPGNKSPSKGKKGKEKEKTGLTPEPTTPVSQDLEIRDVDEEEDAECVFQQLHVSCPDGLKVEYALEAQYGVHNEAQDERILVRQCYPVKTRGVNECESERQRTAMKESSRVVRSDGTVIRILLDGTAEVLYPSGAVSVLTGFPAFLGQSRMSSPQRGGSAKIPGEEAKPETPDKKKGRGRKQSGKDEKEEIQEPKDEGEWITTTHTGERIVTKPGDLNLIESKNAMVSAAFDPETKQIMSTRDDKVIIVRHPNETVIVEHKDGTRITTFNRELQVINDNDIEETGETPQPQTALVKHVKIECPGFACVVFNTETHECMTEFSTGTRIFAQSDGTYHLDYCDSSQLSVSEDGSVVFQPRPNNNLQFVQMQQQLQYVMRHHADVICETVDNEGNIFNVKHNGETSVMMAGQDEMNSVSSDEVDVRSNTKTVHYFKQHAPRFFIIHANGSGTELMRYQDISDYLSTCEGDPDVAILSDPLPDYPGFSAITVMKPFLNGLSEKWLRKYDEEHIIPNGLRSRDLKTIPAVEEKKEGPEFGTNLGQGLAVGSAIKPEPLPPPPKCPSRLEIRQFIQYAPMNDDLRERLTEGLRDYAEFLKSRDKAADEMVVQDPRTQEEKIHASDLVAQISQIPDFIPENVKTTYEKLCTPPPPSPPPTPQPKRTQADWERDRRELAEEMENRSALRNNIVPSYFKSEMGKAFLLSQAPDMETLMKELEEDPRNTNEAAVRSEHNSSSELDGSPQNFTGNTPSKLRPGNPTPAHAQGQSSPPQVRPTNPTPAHGVNSTERPGNPTPKQADNRLPSETPSSVHPIPEKRQEEEALISTVPETDENVQYVTKYNSLGHTVTGDPRTKPVQIPAYLNAGKTAAVPNKRFQVIEDPVRRLVKTSSVSGATEKGQEIIQNLRGFELLPQRVDYGILREGYTYHYIVHLKNTGVDPCRYKIRQPPPSTGLRVVFTPGAVAAGMKAEIILELYAIAVGVEGETGIGGINHEIEITTETDHLSLPVRATVLTANDFDNRIPPGMRVKMAPGVKLISTKPPVTYGIIRPRKSLEANA